MKKIKVIIILQVFLILIFCLTVSGSNNMLYSYNNCPECGSDSISDELYLNGYEEHCSVYYCVCQDCGYEYTTVLQHYMITTCETVYCAQPDCTYSYAGNGHGCSTNSICPTCGENSGCSIASVVDYSYFPPSYCYATWDWCYTHHISHNWVSYEHDWDFSIGHGFCRICGIENYTCR